MNTSLSASLQPITNFFKRFHSILFFLVVSGGLFAAIFALLAIINLSSTTASSSDQVINGTFDQETIERLNNGASSSAQPGSRESPFIE